MQKSCVVASIVEPSTLPEQEKQPGKLFVTVKRMKPGTGRSFYPLITLFQFKFLNYKHRETVDNFTCKPSCLNTCDACSYSNSQPILSILLHIIRPFPLSLPLINRWSAGSLVAELVKCLAKVEFIFIYLTSSFFLK